VLLLQGMNDIASLLEKTKAEQKDTQSEIQQVDQDINRCLSKQKELEARLTNLKTQADRLKSEGRDKNVSHYFMSLLWEEVFANAVLQLRSGLSVRLCCVQRFLLSQQGELDIAKKSSQASARRIAEQESKVAAMQAELGSEFLSQLTHEEQAELNMLGRRIQSLKEELATAQSLKLQAQVAKEELQSLLSGNLQQRQQVHSLMTLYTPK
jgi:chromosome segregation ATPase